MQILTMTPDVQDPESPSRKRSHQDFLSTFGEDSPKKVLHSTGENVPIQHAVPLLPTIVSIVANHSPLAQSSPESLTDAASSTPAGNSPSPTQTPTRHPLFPALPPQQLVYPASTLSKPVAMTAANSSTVGPPPAKRKRATAAEKEEKAKAEAERKQKREEDRTAREVEKARLEEQKKQRAVEKAQERELKSKEKEEEARKREEEKQKKKLEKEEQERKAKEAKENKAKEAKEAKEKKDRNQPTLNMFFSRPPSTPKKAAQLPTSSPAAGGIPAGTPQDYASAGKSEYDRMFQPFFVKQNVRLATNWFQLDDETRAAKSGILDEYFRGERGTFAPTPLDPVTAVEYFHLPSLQAPRGRVHTSVRKILSDMSNADGTSAVPVDLTTESQNAQLRMTENALKAVPMKFLGFREDVRPPYYGTVTSAPASSSLARLARNPSSRQVLPLNYDYDSEAEWVDDGDGEDIEDMDDDEEDGEEDEEMADFLDDAEDIGAVRHAYMSGMEPESTGLCWENRKRLGPSAHMYKFRMEFVLESLEHHSLIDPFSTKYWVTEKSAKATGIGQPPTQGGLTTANPNLIASADPQAMPPPPIPTDAFSQLTASAAAKKKGTIPPEIVNDVKRAILKFATLSKVGLIEVLGSEFTDQCTKTQIKNSIEAIAERTGTGKQKTWKLKEEIAP